MLLVTSRVGQADILRARAVDIDVEARAVERLLDARVGDARESRAILRSSSVRVGEVRRRGSAPRICRSIGAGAPKFRIWLTMSAGRNENVDAGEARAAAPRAAA